MENILQGLFQVAVYLDDIFIKIYTQPCLHPSPITSITKKGPTLEMNFQAILGFQQSPVPIRLVNGTNMCSGRVEVYRKATWGTIYGNDENVNATNVICRVLNCGSALSATQNTYYGEGIGDIWLKEWRCDGREISLDQCLANPQVGNSSTHTKDIGVTCSGSVRTPAQKTCLTSEDFAQKRVGGTVHYSLTGGYFCASDPKVIDTLKEMVISILSSIPRNRIMKLDVNPKSRCRQ
ncbi:scavenger receptor cysteine-rich type 1 protein M130-like [Mustelus asterias]